MYDLKNNIEDCQECLLFFFSDIRTSASLYVSDEAVTRSDIQHGEGRTGRCAEWLEGGGRRKGVKVGKETGLGKKFRRKEKAKKLLKK